MADKTPKKTGYSLQGFDARHYRQTEGYVQAIDALYSSAVNEYSKLVSGMSITPDKVFSFDDYPATKNKAQQIVNQLAAKMQSVIVKGSREQWLYACKKNDEFLKSILNTSKVPKKVLSKYQDRNLDALDTFQKRKINGMNLSQRIWNYSGQMKTQMELGIDIALGEGKSAQALSKDLRQYLVDSDKLFRRVRDKHGNLVLSKNAKAFNPGQGKYRSSYKNAMRLTRSEINMAYRESDQLRWQQLDFVVGFEVKLSNNHTLNGVPFVDICDELVGKYPKNFKFKGWHPQCRCVATPILQDRDEFNEDELAELRAALKGTEYKKLESRNKVTDLPEGFKKWVENNAERSAGWKSQPYFIRDNFKGGTIPGGLKFDTKKPKPVKSPDQKADIQKRWNERQNNNKYSDQLKSAQIQFTDAPSLNTYISTIRNEISAGATPDAVAAMIQKLNHKLEVKKAWDGTKEVRAMADLLVNPRAMVNQFGLQAVKDLHTAVENKLNGWESLSLADLKKKLEFEINWVEQNKKYVTWEGSKKAYSKKLVEVEYKLDKLTVQESVQNALNYAKTTKSAAVKQMAGEVQSMLKADAPMLQLKSKATQLTDKVNKLIADKEAAQIKKKLGSIPGVDQGEFSQARKNAAMWAKKPQESDSKVRDMSGKVWRESTEDERKAAYRYTAGSSYINEPLRGQYYSGQHAGKYDSKLDAQRISNMVDKSSYDFDMWVQRGVGTTAVSNVFGVSISGKTAAQVKSELIGKIGTEPAFSSCGVSKGAGFASSDVIYNIYCPRKTKMLYLEPFSAYGNGDKLSWDGLKKQTSFGYEAEMLLQKNTQFRVTKVDKSGSKWYIDLEVIAQL